MINVWSTENGKGTDLIKCRTSTHHWSLDYTLRISEIVSALDLYLMQNLLLNVHWTLYSMTEMFVSIINTYSLINKCVSLAVTVFCTNNFALDSVLIELQATKLTTIFCQLTVTTDLWRSPQLSSCATMKMLSVSCLWTLKPLKIFFKFKHKDSHVTFLWSNSQFSRLVCLRFLSLRKSGFFEYLNRISSKLQRIHRDLVSTLLLPMRCLTWSE